jgi:hypothetical protein
MADRHIGPGQTYLTFAAAYAAAGAGDTFIFHAGTHTVSAAIGLANITVTTAGDGDVVLDAGGAAYVLRLWPADNFTMGEAPGDVLRLQGATGANLEHYQGDGMALDGVTIKSPGASKYALDMNGAGGGGTGTYRLDNVRLVGVEDGSGVDGRGLRVQSYYPGSTFSSDGAYCLGLSLAITTKYTVVWTRLEIVGGTGGQLGDGFYYSPSQVLKNCKLRDTYRAFYNYTDPGPLLLNCTFDDNWRHLDVSAGIDAAYNCCFTNGSMYIYPHGQTFTNCLFYNQTGHTGETLTDCVTATSDPYLDQPAGDYHLFLGSEAVDAGYDLSGGGTSQVLDDFDGVSRPQGSDYDIGAYELLASWPHTFCGTAITSIMGVTNPASVMGV